ncbi:MAG: glycosyltransferase [Gammaproteobacteria bacterium]|nr:glycosyltransferase [Gammaproteobacteria bacterium]
MKFSLVIPTLNAGSLWKKFISALAEQTLQPDLVLVVDSGSSDGTDLLAEKAGYRVHRIERESFNHGGTRQLAVDLLPPTDIVVFMTQDALLESPNSMKFLLKCFAHKGGCSVGAVCGRQLPHINATPIASHSRLYNYKEKSNIFSKDDIPRLGLKSTFMSDSFSAYSIEALKKVGGFETSVVVCEDTFLAGRILLSGYKTVYSAEATVRHSHNFGLLEEARRYFDIGVAHASQSWFIEEFGEPEGEGFRYMRSEVRYLLRISPVMLPLAIFRDVLKYVFYRLGRKEKYLSNNIKKNLSYQRYFWKNECG